jgi:hypothetical protein
MMRLPKLTVVMCVVAVGLRAQTQPPEGQPSESEEARAVVERICKMDVEGRWLGPERWDELRYFFIEVAPWSPPESISVLKGYRVGDVLTRIGAEGKVVYQVEVDYAVWGTIDSFLHFTRAPTPSGQSPATCQPVEEKTFWPLYFTDRIVERHRSGE